MALHSEQSKRITWKVYRSWPDDQRWQVIGGHPCAMSAAPLTRHQRVLSRLHAALVPFLSKGDCEVLPAPTDLKLSDEDIVQPDLMIICNPDQIKDTHVEGPPSLIIEILSPTTEQLDRGLKLDLYAKSGVKEVWLVTPYPALLEIFTLQAGAYRREHGLRETSSFQCPSFPDLNINLESLFDLPIPPEDRIDIVKETPPPYPTAKVGS